MTSDEPESEGGSRADEGPSVPVRVIAGVAATVTGLAATTVAGPIAGAFVTSGLTPVFERIADIDRRAAENAARTTERAAPLAWMTPHELAVWAEGSPSGWRCWRVWSRQRGV